MQVGAVFQILNTIIAISFVVFNIVVGVCVIKIYKLLKKYIEKQ